MGKPWLKLWTETLHDRKLLRVAPAWRWAWIGLLMLAAETDDNGKIELSPGVPLEEADIEDALRIDPADWQGAKEYFERIGMLDQDNGIFVVVNYTKRQASSDPTNAARQARYKERSNALRNALPVTPVAPLHNALPVTPVTPLQSRVEEEAEVEAETTSAPNEFAALYRFWCDTTTRSGGGDTVSLLAVFEEWKDRIDSNGIRAAIVSAAQAKGMAATPTYLAGILRNRAKAAKSGNGTLRMYVEAEQ